MKVKARFGQICKAKAALQTAQSKPMKNAAPIEGCILLKVWNENG